MPGQNGKRKVGIICSSGGHLTEALSVLEAFEGLDRFLVVHDFPSLGSLALHEIDRIYKLRLIGGYSTWLKVFLTICANCVALFKILWKERPAILFSTGAEIAIPAFYIGKIFFGCKLIFLESLARVKDFSYTGKLLYPIADLFLVQWQDLAGKRKPKALYRGRII